MALTKIQQAGLAANSVIAASIADGTIIVQDLADNSVSASKLAAGAVDLAGAKVTGSVPLANVTGLGALATLDNVPQANLIGTLAVSQGGTGLTSPGSSGNILLSDGTGWTSAAAPASVQFVGMADSFNLEALEIGTFGDLTGLTASLTAGTWLYKVDLGFFSGGTPGCKFRMNYTGTITSIDYVQSGQASTTALGAATRQTTNGATGMTAYATTSNIQAFTQMVGRIIVTDSAVLSVQGARITNTASVSNGSMILTKIA